MNKQKIFTGDFILGTTLNFFLMLNYYTPIVVMAVYATDTLKASVSGGGLAAGIFVIGALVARVLCGKWMETTGRRKMLIYSSLATLLINIMYFAASTLPILIAVRFLHGLAYGAVATAIGTIVASGIPAERRGEGLGYYLLSITVASAIGPFLGMNLMSHFGFITIFVACNIMAFLSFIMSLFIKVSENKQQERKVISIGSGLSKYIEFPVVPISLVCFISYFCYSGVMTFLTPYAKAEGFASSASFYFIVYSASILMTRPYTGRLFDTKGENITMYPSFIAFAAGMFLLGAAHNSLSILASAAFVGLGLGAIQSCGLAIAVRMTPPERLGLANSTFYMFVDAGVGIGPVILGLGLSSTGYRGMYYTLGVLSVLCVGIYYFLHGKKRTEEINVAQTDQPAML